MFQRHHGCLNKFSILILSDGSRVSIFSIRSQANLLTFFHSLELKLILPLTIFNLVCGLSLLKNGKTPDSITYSTMPMLHISVFSLYFIPIMISGEQ